MGSGRTLGARLAQQARDRFVGRAGELAFLLESLTEKGPLVVHLYGVAGVGKSALLSAFAREARAREATVLEIDCRNVEPTERGLLRALARASGAAEPELAAVAGRFSALRPPVLLVLDAYEVFRLMDTWVRRRLLPGLPEHVRVVLAGRQPPVASWLSSPEWHGLFRSLSLGALPERDSARLLELAGVTGEAASRIQLFARGHPLALQLAARAVTDSPGVDLERMTLQRVLEELARVYLGDVEDRSTRNLLEACCVLRRVTRSLLEAIEPSASGAGADEALRALPFVERRADGWIVHDAVREAVAASLRTTDPVRHRAVRLAAWRTLREEVRRAGPDELWSYTADMLYLLENPVVREAFFPSSAQHLYVEPAREEDGAAIAEIVSRHEEPDPAGKLVGWWERLPSAFHVVREGDGAVAGLYCLLDPAVAPRTALENDPVTRTWCRHLVAAPTSASESVLFVRRWLSRDHGEVPSPAQAAAWLDLKRSYMELRPRLRRVYLGVVDLAPYAPAASRLRFRALPELDVACGGVRYATAMLDLGPASVDGWLAELVSAELQMPEEGILDFAARELVTGARRVPLTHLEFGLISYLMQCEDRAVSRTELLRRVWGYEYGAASNVVEQVGDRSARSSAPMARGSRRCEASATDCGRSEPFRRERPPGFPRVDPTRGECRPPSLAFGAAGWTFAAFARIFGAPVKRHAPATSRNREPILALLRELLPEGARVLEIASGTGEHAAAFARALPRVTWQPSDVDPEALASIEAWRRDAGAPANLLPASVLDVTAPGWDVGPVDAVVAINLVHIAPWRAAEGLFAGAARVLAPRGILFLYGPYRFDGAFTAPSNAAFDAALRASDPAWGVRDVRDLTRLGAEQGLVREVVVAMPANNHCLVFRRT